MLKSRDEVVHRITYRCQQLISSKKTTDEFCQKLVADFEFPYAMANDLITLRVNAANYDDFTLFALMSVLQGTKHKDIEEYFTESEIKKYSVQKYSAKKYKLPIRWHMVQIAEDQWVGSIEASELVKLSNARLINYNENIQRPLSRKTVNGEEYYYITINEAAVAGITESFTNGTYIPNTITLNMPETSDFVYDEESGDLVVKDIEAFDIIDGYHRYVALQRIFIKNKSFDYKMELRVTCFSEEKAKQFIWQEDQKTKMSKIDSDSMNQNSIANQVVSRLNSKSPFTGIINNNSGKIDAALFARLINLYFVDDKKKTTRAMMVELSDKIFKYMNILVDEEPELLDKRWKTEYLVAMLQSIYWEIPEDQFYDYVYQLNYKLCLPENEPLIHNFKTKMLRKVDINRLDKVK